MHNTWVVYMSTYGKGDFKTPLKGCLLDKVSGKSLRNFENFDQNAHTFPLQKSARMRRPNLSSV